jgi:(p)ppGpp synthase/HD superfamily hydrolase
MGAGLGIPNSAEGLAKTQDALDCARKLHAGQSRKDEGGPFILHPLEVASLLYAAGAPDPSTLWLAAYTRPYDG